MKLNLNSARKGNSDYKFNPLSLVSIDYGRIQPTLCFSVLPGSKWNKVRGKGLLRLTPQVFPPFGRMNVKSAAFFVPDSQIYSWSSSFHANNKQWRGQSADNLPGIQSYLINTFFFNSFGGSALSTVVSSNPTLEPGRTTYDFTYPSSNRSNGTTNLEFIKLTPLGWKLYALFKALGYDFVTFCTDTTNSMNYSQHLDSCSTRISLVPFLSYCKIWNDYFCNSYQSDQTTLASHLQSIYLNKDIVVAGITYYSSNTKLASYNLLLSMVSQVLVPYETNMYTTAWNTPNDPTGTEISRINQVNSQSLISPFGSNSDGEFASLSLDSYRNKHSTAVSSNVATFSQLGHRTLESFDKFVRRRGLMGSKSVQQLYALFGIELEEWSKDYVVKLCESSSRVNFSAVMSQANTVSGSHGSPLGAYAGTGLCGYDLQFNYNPNTYGTIICLSWLNIDPILMHGLSPDVLRTKPLDFYNPDFDGKAFRPIPFAEVTGAKCISFNNATPNQIFGYTNMYDDYRMMRDVVAGSFLDEITRHFAFMRDLTEVRESAVNGGGDMYPQSSDVQYWYLDGSSDVTNPFVTDPSLGDRFWFCIDWDINTTQPILSPSNSFDLDGEGSLSVKKNGDGMA